jgi:hypothetical protein
MPVPVPAPVVHLAIALGRIAGQATVTKFVQGAPFDRKDWANVAGQIAEALIGTSLAQESTFQGLGEQIDRIGGKIDQIPLREYAQHMAAGRRYLREVTPQWRTELDRRDMIRDARGEFVRAAAIAEVGNDLVRQVAAELAVAGCWLWVPSLDDVKNTITNARTLFEQEILFGAECEALHRGEIVRPHTDSGTCYYLTAAYADVVALARGYGEQPPNTGDALQGLETDHFHGARLTVRAVPHSFVACAGVQLKLDARAPGAIPGAIEPDIRSGVADGVTVTVSNTRNEWIAVRRIPGAVIVTLPTNGTLPGENRVAPHSQTTVSLPGTSYYAPGIPLCPPPGTIGFLLPEQGIDLSYMVRETTFPIRGH